MPGPNRPGRLQQVAVSAGEGVKIESFSTRFRVVGPPNKSFRLGTESKQGILINFRLFTALRTGTNFNFRMQAVITLLRVRYAQRLYQCSCGPCLFKQDTIPASCRALQCAQLIRSVRPRHRPSHGSQPLQAEQEKRKQHRTTASTKTIIRLYEKIRRRRSGHHLRSVCIYCPAGCAIETSSSGTPRMYNTLLHL